MQLHTNITVDYTTYPAVHFANKSAIEKIFGLSRLYLFMFSQLGSVQSIISCDYISDKCDCF